MAAILLPWKLLTVMATNAFPGVVPSFMRGLDDPTLMMTLGGGACAAFVLYSLAELSIGLACRDGSERVLARHQKTGLFGGHRRQAAGLYRSLLKAVSAVLAIIMISFILAWIYPLLLVALASYLLVGVLWVSWRRGKVSGSPPLAPELKSNAWWGLGFLYAVGWIAGDYWRGASLDLTKTFIALLLIRQSVVLAGMAWRTYALFERQHTKAGALFLRDVPWHPVASTEDGFLSLADAARRQQWVGDVLKCYQDIDGVPITGECRVVDSGRMLTVTARLDSDDGPRSFFLRLFHSSSEEGSQHERGIMETATVDWPAPALLGCHKVEGHDCLVYDWQERAHWMSAAERSAHLPGLRIRLLSCRPSDALLLRHERSRPHLANRLASVDWQYLESILPEKLVEDGSILSQCWQEICDLARVLPGQVVIPQLYRHRIGRAGGAALICNWARWSWEPVGSGWPLRSDVELYEEAISRASALRPELAAVDGTQARLMAHLYEFEIQWRSKSYSAAIRLIPDLAEIAREAGIPDFSC